MRDKFTFFGSFRDTAKAIQDKELRLAYLEAVIDYGLAGLDPPDPIVQALMIQTKFIIDKSLKISASASERWKDWWAPQGNKNACKNWSIDKKQAKSSKNKLTQAKTNEVEEEVEEENKIKDKEIADAIEKSWLEEKVIDLYIDFLNQREANKIKNTLQATKQHLNLLLKQENEAIRLKILENSINNSWRWLFELNEKDLAKLRECEPPKPYQPPPQNDLDPILT